MSSGARGQERGRAPSPAQGTVGPCPSPGPALPAGLRRKLGSPEGSGRGSLGHSRDGVTGKEPRERPQAGHGVIVRSLPTGSLAQDTLQDRWPCPDTSDPAAQGVNRVPAPLGTHRHRGDGERGQPGVRPHFSGQFGRDWLSSSRATSSGHDVEATAL